MIPTSILSDHNNIICTIQYLRKCQIQNPLSNQTSWNTNRTTPFNPKTVYKKQCTTGGMPHLKPTDFDMTKHSNYFVWKETSERVARRCDYTVDKKRVNSCVPKHLFLERDEQPKISPKKPRNALSDALLMSLFQNFAADTAKNKTARIYWNRGSRGFS